MSSTSTTTAEATADSGPDSVMFYFSPAWQAWTRLGPIPAPPASDEEDGRRLTLLTFNVWFDAWQSKLRWSEILRLIGERRPTVACLQEVVPGFVELLARHEAVQRHYFISAVSTVGPEFCGYGTMLLVRRTRYVTPPHALYCLPLTTRMGRSVLTVEFAFNGRLVGVHTVHLESLDSRKVRAQQLLEFMGQYAHRASLPGAPLLTLFAGDFNFCSYRNYADADDRPLEQLGVPALLPGFVDVWPTIHGVQPPPRLDPPSDAVERARMGYTFDSQRNTNIGNHEIMRYDRVFARAEGPAFAIEDIELLDKPVKGQPAVWPSDHFGLLATFILLATEQPSP